MPTKRNTQTREQEADLPAADGETPTTSTAHESGEALHEPAQAREEEAGAFLEGTNPLQVIAPDGTTDPIIEEKEEEAILDRNLEKLEQRTRTLCIFTKQARLARIEAEKLRLEQNLAGEAPATSLPPPFYLSPVPADTTSNPGIRPESSVLQEVLRHKRLASSDLEIRSKRKRLEPFRKFKGDLLVNHREFIRDCNLHFEQSPADFLNNRLKILHTIGALEGDARNVWYNYYKQDDHSVLSWNFFKEFMRNIIASPAVREMDVKQKYTDARQDAGQSVRKFDVYLSSLEAQIKEFSELQQRNNLFTRLNKKLQVGLTQRGEIPVTRIELVSAAALLEDVDNRAKRVLNKSTPDEKSLTAQHQRNWRGERKQTLHRTGEEPAKTSSSKQNSDVWKKNIHCYQCGRKSHIKPECPNTDAGTGLKANVNQIPIRRTEKGKASQKTPEGPEKGAQ